MAKKQRPEVPAEMVRRLGEVLLPLPRVHEEDAWVGVRWRVGQATIAHVFGGEDQLFRVVFRAEGDEVMALEHMGPPYFRTEWGFDHVGMLLDDDTDWDEVAELLTDSYCVVAPVTLAAQVERPDHDAGQRAERSSQSSG